MIVLGIILWISGETVATMGIVYHAGGWFTSSWYELTWLHYCGIVMILSGVIAILLGISGITVTVIREYLDQKGGGRVE